VDDACANATLRRTGRSRAFAHDDAGLGRLIGEGVAAAMGQLIEIQMVPQAGLEPARAHAQQILSETGLHERIDITR
jgi:hypothetical protein